MIQSITRDTTLRTQAVWSVSRLWNISHSTSGRLSNTSGERVSRVTLSMTYRRPSGIAAVSRKGVSNMSDEKYQPYPNQKPWMRLVSAFVTLGIPWIWRKVTKK